MIKKSLLAFTLLLLLLITVSAQEVDLGISLPKDKFGVGENIGIQITLKDSQGSKINTELNILFEDTLTNKQIRKIMTNNPTTVNLGANPTNGLWKITATYEDARAVSWILIEETENATLRLDGDILTIKNTGNTIYSKTVSIVIGEELSTKKVTLAVGESTTLRLVAPKGVYNVRITDGKTTISRGGVTLTGKAIGFLDDQSGGSLITTTNPENIESGGYNFLKRGNFAYMFVMTVVGATILLAIERHYRRKVKRR